MLSWENEDSARRLFGRCNAVACRDRIQLAGRGEVAAVKPPNGLRAETETSNVKRPHGKEQICSTRTAF
jgi:hypothetical protein